MCYGFAMVSDLATLRLAAAEGENMWYKQRCNEPLKILDIVQHELDMFKLKPGNETCSHKCDSEF